MARNILVITGSPRKGGNSDILAEAFIRGAESRNHVITRFEAAHKSIGGCKACNSCWSTGRACTFEDGFTELEPLLEQADAVVFASPLYWFGMSAQIKSAIDRLYAYVSDKKLRPLNITESVLLMVAGDDDPAVFDGAVASYRLMAEYMRWQSVGVLTVPGMYEKGDIAGNKALAQAERMGARM